MSKSNASAKNRRAFGGNPPTPVPVPVQSSNMSPGNHPSSAQGFTLTQVIAVIDNRLLNLEKFVKESKDNAGKHVQFENVQMEQSQIEHAPVDNSVAEMLNEFSARFDMIADEMGSLKEIVLKLQSYTMDVNKTLFEERIHILSDLGTNNHPVENQIYDITDVPCLEATSNNNHESNELI